MKKRLISLNLAILMMISSVLPVFAVGTDEIINPASEETRYTITYDGNGSFTSSDEKTVLDTATESEEYTIVESEFLQLTPEKYFMAWNTEENGSGDWYFPGDKIQVENDLTLYAAWGNHAAFYHWTNSDNEPQITAAISRESNSQSGIYIYQFSVPAGKTFTSFNTKEDGSGAPYYWGNYTDFSPNEIVHLYAQYEDVTGCYVKYDGSGGLTVANEDCIILDNLSENDEINIIENPYTHPEGENFLGWCDGVWENGTWYFEGDTVQLTDNLELYAQWGDHVIFYHYFNEDGDHCTNARIGDSTVRYYPHSNPSGQILIGWNSNITGDGDWYYNNDDIDTSQIEILHLYAQYKNVPEGELFIKYEGNGCSTADGDTYLFAENLKLNDTISVISNPFEKPDGKIFLGWEDKTGHWYDEGEIITLTESLTLKAQWGVSGISYHETNPNGEAVKNTSSSTRVHSYYNNTVENQVFVGWNDLPDGTGNWYGKGEKISIANGQIFDLYAQYKSVADLDYYCLFEANKFADGRMVHVCELDSSTDVITLPSADITIKPFVGWISDKTILFTDYKIGLWEDIPVAHAPGTEISVNHGDKYCAFALEDTGFVIYNGNGAVDSKNRSQLTHYTSATGDALVLYSGDEVFDAPEEKIFKNWNTAADGSGHIYTSSESVWDEALMLFAQWENENEAIVTYHGVNGETTDGKDLVEVTINTNEKTTISDNPFISSFGENFLGWNIKANGTGTWYFPGDEVQFESDVDLYAQWGDNAVVYHWIRSDGTEKVNCYFNETSVYYSPSSEPEGKAFINWNTSIDGMGTTYNQYESIDLPLGTVLHVYAQYQTVDGFYIRYDGNGQKTTNDASFILEDGYTSGDIVTPKANLFIAPEGEKLLGWEDDDGNWYSVGDSITLTENITLTAQWGENVVFFHWIDSDGEERLTSRFNRSSIYYNVSSEPIGKAFINWNTTADGTGTSYEQYEAIELLPGTVLHIYAQYQDADGLYIRYNGNGQLTSNGYSFVLRDGYAVGETVTLDSNLFVAPEGEKLLVWEDDSANWYAIGDSITLTESLTLTAQWGKNAIVYHWTDENGNAKVRSYLNESTVYCNFSSEPAGKVFLNWNTKPDFSGTSYMQDDPIELSDGEILHLYARYEDYSGYYIKYEGAGYKTIDGASFVLTDGYASGQTITLASTIFTPPEGKLLLGWKDDDGNWYEADESITVNQNLVLTALYGNHCVIYHTKNNNGDNRIRIRTDDEKTMNLNSWLYQTNIPLGWNTENDGSGVWLSFGDNLSLSNGQILHLYCQYEKIPETGYYYVLKAEKKLSNGRCAQIIPLTSETQEIILPNLFTEDTPAYGWVPIENHGNVFKYNHSCGNTEFCDPATEIPGVLKPGTKYTVKSGEQFGALMNSDVCEVIYHGNGATTENGETSRKQIEVATGFDLKLYSGSQVFETPIGKVFDSWNTEPDGSGKTYNANQEIWAGILNLFAQWTGSADGKNEITVSGASHGSVSLTPTNASEGETVTIEVDPDSGYRLDSIVVTDASGNTLELTRISSTKYSFVMPATAVSVFIDFDKKSNGSSTTGSNSTKDEPITEPEATVLPFSDLSTYAAAEDAVRYVYDNGLMVGTSETTFSPEVETDRAMILSIIWRIVGSPEPIADNKFTDVVSGSYYEDAVLWATQSGLIVGYGDGRVGALDQLSTAQIFCILHRYAGSVIPTQDYLATYPDGADVPFWARDAVNWALENNLVVFDDGMLLTPNQTITRIKLAQILMNFCTNQNIQTIA